MKVILLIISLLICFRFYGQHWTLEQCIDTALKNNYSIKTSKIKSDIASINVISSKQKLLPSLNGGATHGYNWGQTIDPFTNQFATNRVQYNNFYLSSSIVLFSGLQNYYGIKVSEINYENQLINQDIENRNIKIEIAASYMQVLLNNELLNVSLEHLALTKNEKEKQELLIETGNSASYKLTEVKAQLALDKFNILKAQNDLNYSLLLLQQLLNLPYDSTFNIQKKDSIYEANLNQTPINYSEIPELKLVEKNIEKQLLQIKSTKGSLYPSLRLNGSMGSGYSGNNKYLSQDGEFIPKPFTDQLRGNFYQSASIGLNIPIFNKNSTRTQLKLNELQLQQMYLEKEQQKLMVQNKIEQLKMDVDNASGQYLSAQSVFKASKINFENYHIQYENNTINYLQLLEAKNKLFEAQSKLIQAKYSLKFKRLILNYYLP